EVSTRPLTYTVQRGQSLIDIAVMFRVPVKALMEANRIPEPRVLREGEVLIIPTLTPSPAPVLPMIGGPEKVSEYPAPIPLTPAEGAIYKGPEAKIVLSWTSLWTLEEDEWFVVRLKYQDRNSRDWSEEELYWTQTTSFLLPSHLAPPAEASPRLFRWDVIIVKKHITLDGQVEMVELSPASQPREFYWH
ncbi:MAG: LysM domain-containing protein, partial [Anaerolineae bacterium]|nr:LysM domain-containing protein [Anaerolineae bacterium]